MDKHVIRIIPKIMNATMLFVCQFNDTKTGDLITLLDVGRNGQVHVGPLEGNQKPKEMSLNIRSVVEFEFDKDDRADQNLKNYLGYWGRDPRVQVKGTNVNAATSSMVMEDMTETKSATVASIKDKRRATQKFEAFGGDGQLRGWKNIAYYFGVPNADALLEDDLYITLIEPSTGILVQPENIQRFLKYNSSDFDTQLAINTSRAIEKGFIEKKSVQGGGESFFINNQPIGKSESDVIIYLKNHKDFYSGYVVEKLGDEAENEKALKKETTDENIVTVDMNALRAQVKEKYQIMKEMGIKNTKASKHAQITTVEGLQEALREANQLIEEKNGKATLTPNIVTDESQGVNKNPDANKDKESVDETADKA